MPYGSQNKQEEIKKQKGLRDARKQARQTIRKYNTGKNKGQAAGTIKSAKNLLKNATPWGIFSLLREGSLFSDWMYGLALFAAILKDIIDFSEATGFLYGFVIVATFLCSIFIAFMMLLGSFSNGYGRRQQKIIRSWLVLLSGTAVEMLFGINFLPLESLTVLIIYVMMLSERKQARQEQEEERRMDVREAQESYA